MSNRIKESSAVEVSIGIDIGEKKSQVVALAANGGILLNRPVTTTARALRKSLLPFLDKAVRCVMEGGTHSAWIDRLAKNLGFESVVANPRAPVLRANAERGRKNDRADAQDLAEWGLNPRFAHFLRPINHRSKQAQLDLTTIRAREALVRTRTALICEVRSLAKNVEGIRFGRVNAEVFHRVARESLPETLKAALLPLIGLIAELNAKIRSYDQKIEEIASEGYPETRYLRQVRGVGTLTALAFVLTLEQPERFARSRRVGAFLGMTPRQYQSGARDPQLRITKCGDAYLRKLLVQCANYILGPFGGDCYLRDFGERLIAKGGKHAKKRARVAVARKLAVLLHRLWRTKEEYDPMRNTARQSAA